MYMFGTDKIRSLYPPPPPHNLRIVYVRIEAHPTQPVRERSFLDPIQTEEKKNRTKEGKKRPAHSYHINDIGFDFNGIKTCPNQCVLFLKAIRLMKSNPSTLKLMSINLSKGQPYLCADNYLCLYIHIYKRVSA
jgi:hypothetical protein